jgi:rSAM/selenodomain-associated transferase 1
MAETTICVFAKPPVPGKSKTRLAAAIGVEQAARLAEAFLLDTLHTLQQLDWADAVIAATEPFECAMMRTDQVWIQPQGTLDVRIEAMLRRALKQSKFAIAIGADSPGLPIAYLRDARDRLQSKDAVLGPAKDGGFYLLGLRKCPAGLLHGIQWSLPTTMEQTVQRLEQEGFSLAFLPEWFDVDITDDLSHLRTLLAQDVIRCSNTRAVMEGINWPTLAAQEKK